MQKVIEAGMGILTALESLTPGQDIHKFVRDTIVILVYMRFLVTECNSWDGTCTE
jgi:hypothetical protein